MKNKFIKKIIISILILGLIGITIPVFTNHWVLYTSALDETIEWNITIQITEPNGAGNTIVFGQRLDASDDLDPYDLPEPPAPPQQPFIRAWFETSYKIPFNNLLQEYKSSSSDHLVWNLSLIWIAAAGNLSNTTLDIQWESPFVNTETHSLRLYKNEVIVADMISEDSYSFLTNGSLHRFQIIYQRKISTTGGTPMNLPFLLLMMGAVLSIVIVASVIFFLKRKKN